MENKIRNFTDLKVWQEGHGLVLLVYKIVGKFPGKERFVLSSQILRAVISVTSNIAEGFGRQGLKEKIQFYFVAQASLIEVQNQLIIARDVGYLDKDKFDVIWEKIILVHRLLSGLIRSLRSK